MIQQKILAFDVSLGVLDSFDGSTACCIQNSSEAISGVLQSLDPETIIVMEATNHYYEQLAFLAHAAGFTVYVFNPLVASKYMDFVADNVRDDKSSARALYSLAAKELDRFDPFAPNSRKVSELEALIKSRAKLVRLKESLAKSHRDLTRGGVSVKPTQTALTCLTRQIAKLDETIASKAQKFKMYDVLLSAPCVGPVYASALTWHLSRRSYPSADKLVGSLGLSIKKERSGKGHEIRYLSKQGDAYMRSLTFLSGSSAIRCGVFKGEYAALRARGLSYKEACLTLGRRILRIVYALVRDMQKFDPKPFEKRREERKKPKTKI
jgi:transposase